MNITNPYTVGFLALLFYVISATSFMGFRTMAQESGFYVPQFKAVEVTMIDPLADTSTPTKKGAR